MSARHRISDYSTKEAAKSSKRGYEASEACAPEIHDIKHRLHGLEKTVDAIRPTTAEYAQVRDRVVFSGCMGRWLWGVGKALISAAVGATACRYAMTERPPP
ncbi:hypothetical protein [Pseudaminobacter salicylatoxidans]|uniref:hypothetical protein n=1 Tax=Pseudaminobacter salicylatoxidans TaxID=93369 RepID=UPI001AECF00C|nr:hypothetical protein [Pseudaminobacter salicylatoxidans]